MKVYVTLELFDRGGKRVSKRRFRSRSYVEAWLSIIKAQMDPGTNVASVTDTGGTDRTLIDYAINLSIAAVGNTRGVVVGTGSTAVVVTDYSLETIIADGISTGQLSHGTQSVSSMTVSDPNASFTVQRDFTNSSGASITVNECGIYGDCRESLGTTKQFLFIRDIVSGGQAVPDGQTLRVTYTIQTAI